MLNIEIMDEYKIIKSRIKTLKAILYLVMLVWFMILCYTIYDFIIDEINPFLVLALVLLVSSMSIIKLLKSAQDKKLKDLENKD